ncbi:hypothetical protein Scep_021062 [Stephania cephalantha]|uniref:Uncharacterized protein n=1 Tax=Stephania cephalantha TaxID=152367 RepID=A0AAP0HWJ1_9MAGN
MGVEEGGLVKIMGGGELFKMMESLSDFGWGKPVWIGVLNGASKNIIMYLDTKSGDGVDAWIAMAEEEDTARGSNPCRSCSNMMRLHCIMLLSLLDRHDLVFSSMHG